MSKLLRYLKKYKKKPWLVLIIVLLFVIYVLWQNSSAKITVTKDNLICTDGDTFTLNNETVRLIAIDTPEIGTDPEAYSLEAKNFTCNSLKDAQEIKFLADVGNEKDKYGRSLYWVYIDDLLLQELLLKEGLAQIKYVDKNTVNIKNLALMEAAQASAKYKKIKIWANH